VVPGTLNGAEYTSIYKLPATANGQWDFTAGGNRYLKVRYEGLYFDDGIGVNRGLRFEEFPD